MDGVTNKLDTGWLIDKDQYFLTDSILRHIKYLVSDLRERTIPKNLIHTQLGNRTRGFYPSYQSRRLLRIQRNCKI